MSAEPVRRAPIAPATRLFAVFLIGVHVSARECACFDNGKDTLKLLTQFDRINL